MIKIWRFYFIESLNVIKHSRVVLHFIFQLVTIAVYSYFIAALFGRQGLDDSNGKFINGYKHIGGLFDSIPLFLALEFVFFIGWLKAAEVLINPYGKMLRLCYYQKIDFFYFHP